MSNWTHVAAIARIDTMMPLTGELDFVKMFGKTCRYEDSSEIWEDVEKHSEAYLPMGSEGSLQMSIWQNPDESHVAAYTVSIFGDLRDHHSCDEIIEWLKSRLKDVWVRQAVITVENEQNGTKTWTYSPDEYEDFEK